MTHDEISSTERRIRGRQTVRVVLAILVLAAIVIFAAANTQKVSVDWVFDDTDTALWIVIAVSTVAGFALGVVAARRRR